MYVGCNVGIVGDAEAATVVDVEVAPVDEVNVLVTKLTEGCVDVDTICVCVDDCGGCGVVGCVVSGKLCTVEAIIVVVFSPSDLLRSRKATYKNKLNLSCGDILIGYCFGSP